MCLMPGWWLHSPGTDIAGWEARPLLAQDTRPRPTVTAAPWDKSCLGNTTTNQHPKSFHCPNTSSSFFHFDSRAFGQAPSGSASNVTAATKSREVLVALLGRCQLQFSRLRLLSTHLKAVSWTVKEQHRLSCHQNIGMGNEEDQTEAQLAVIFYLAII